MNSQHSPRQAYWPLLLEVCKGRLPEITVFPAALATNGATNGHRKAIHKKRREEHETDGPAPAWLVPACKNDLEPGANMEPDPSIGPGPLM